MEILRATFTNDARSGQIMKHPKNVPLLSTFLTTFDKTVIYDHALFVTIS